jgi:ribosomal protein S18 acetylase RimI-like enzyme
MTVMPPEPPLTDIRLVHVVPGREVVLARIADDVFDAPIDPDLTSRFLAAPGHILFVACGEGGLVVGQCLGIVMRAVDRPDSLLIENLGVDPAWRRRGLGRDLVRAVCAEGHAQGATSMWLGVDPDSETAAPFYRAMGFGLRDSAFCEVDLPL